VALHARNPARVFHALAVVVVLKLQAGISIMASWPLPIIHPTTSVGAVAFIIFILRDSGAARKVASLASSGYEKAGSA
jgi:hypothetical protein